MPANTNPVFTLTADVSTDGTTSLHQGLTTAANDYTGASANYTLVHTAGSNGSYIRRLRFKASGTNVATVARVFINNGSTQTTAANNVLFGEISLPSTTATATAATADIDYPLEFALEAGFRIYVGLGTTVAAGWDVVCIAGQY
jgi:biotin carboxylase